MIDLSTCAERHSPVALDARLLAMARAPHLPRRRLAALVILCPQTLLAWSQERGLAPAASSVSEDAICAPAWELRAAIRNVVAATTALPRSADGDWRQVLHTAATVQALAEYLGLPAADVLGGRALIAQGAIRPARVDDVLLADMIDYWDQPVDLLADAHPGVILLATACAMRSGDTERAEQLAALINIPARRLRAAHEGTASDVGKCCEALGLDEEDAGLVAEALRVDLACSARVDRLTSRLAHQSSVDHLRTCAQRTLAQWFDGCAVAFYPDEQANCLRLAESSPGPADTGRDLLRVRPGSGRNLVAECVRQERVLHAAGEPQPLTVLDRQLLRRLGSDDAVYVPLLAENTAMGALVLGRRTGDSAARHEVLLEWFAITYAEWLHVRTLEDQRLQALEAQHLAASEQRLREVVHEANNPLSIVHNYLHILGLRLEDDDAGREQLQMIGEEIRRTSEILQGLLEAPHGTDSRPETATESAVATGRLDRVIDAVAGLLAPVLAARSVTLSVEPVDQAIWVAMPDERLRQLVSNLVRSAGEALTTGGCVHLLACADVVRDGVPSAELTVRRVPAEATPGAPPQAQCESVDGVTHDSVALQVVQRLVHGAGGSVTVRGGPASEASVTVLLPLAS